DRVRVVMLAGAASPDKAVLSAAIALDLGVLERLPIRGLVAKPADIALGDFFKRQIGHIGRPGVAGDAHLLLLLDVPALVKLVASPFSDVHRRLRFRSLKQSTKCGAAEPDSPAVLNIRRNETRHRPTADGDQIGSALLRLAQQPRE